MNYFDDFFNLLFFTFFWIYFILMLFHGISIFAKRFKRKT